MQSAGGGRPVSNRPAGHNYCRRGALWRCSPSCFGPPPPPCSLGRADERSKPAPCHNRKSAGPDSLEANRTGETLGSANSRSDLIIGSSSSPPGQWPPLSAGTAFRAVPSRGGVPRRTDFFVLDRVEEAKGKDMREPQQTG